MSGSRGRGDLANRNARSRCESRPDRRIDAELSNSSCRRDGEIERVCRYPLDRIRSKNVVSAFDGDGNGESKTRRTRTGLALVDQVHDDRPSFVVLAPDERPLPRAVLLAWFFERCEAFPRERVGEQRGNFDERIFGHGRQEIWSSQPPLTASAGYPSGRMYSRPPFPCSTMRGPRICSIFAGSSRRTCERSNVEGGRFK